MTSPHRLLPALLAALAVLLVPTFSVAPAQGVGSGNPAIVTPADGESYSSDSIPDLVVDFGGAAFGSYDWSVKDADSSQVLQNGSFDYDATDQGTQTLASLAGLGDGSYVASVAGAGGTVTSTFGVFTVILGPPPTLCEVQVPAEVRVVAPSTAVYPRFRGCEGQSEAWAVRHRVGSRTLTYGTFTVVDGRSAGPWRFRDSWPTGGYQVVSRTPYGPDTSTVIKLGSRVSLTAGTKVGTRFRLSGSVTRYVPSADGFRSWADRPVAISYKNCAAGCSWRYLVTDRTDSRGYFTLSPSSSSVRYWRATVASTLYVWGRTSTAVKR